MATTSTYLSPKIYTRRAGTSSSGWEYEHKITALLSLRCATMEDTEDMWIGSNIDEVGDFDDIVLSKRTTEGKHIVYLIQLKHKDDPKNIKRCDFSAVKKKKQDFSLVKYSAGFPNLKRKLENPAEDETEVIQCLRKVDEIVFVLYTNRGVDNCEFLECVTDSSLAFLNTGGAQHYSYSFDHTKLNHDSEFLQQLMLFCNQVHVTQLDNMIKSEIKKVLGSSKMTNVDFEEVAKNFLEFIKTWMKGKINKKGNVCYTLKKIDVINQLTAILLKQHTLKFSNDFYNNYNCPKKNLWNEIVRDVLVTVVDLDEGVLEFLKCCIGEEIERYCEETKKTWKDHLSKNVVDSFYEKHSNLNNQILRIMESDRKLTMFDLYQSLWFNAKLPLLLIINDTKSYNDVMRILKISNYNLRVIIINKSNSLLPVDKVVFNHFRTLSDLNVQNRDNVLDISVKLQGRLSVVLKEVVDDSMYKFVSCNDIIDILLNNFSIGSEYEPLDKYFIPRSLFKIFLKPSALSRIKDEQFVIQTQNNDDELLNNKFSMFASNNTDNSNLFFITKDNLTKIQELKSRAQIIHRLIFHDENSLEWKESCGDTRNIREYKKKSIDNLSNSLKKTIEDDVSCSLGNTMRIISAIPGMGKSTSLDYVANEAPTNLWVLTINLLDHNQYYKSKTVKSRANDHLKYFNDAILKKYKYKNIELARAIFEKFLKTKQVLVLLDGFDEISIGYKDKVTKIAECLHEGGFPLWLTTRPHMKTHLENQLDTLSTTLKPFTTDDQELFLNKYFSEVAVTGANTEERQILIQEFITKLLRAARGNLIDRDSEFTGIPLQTKLLADVFIDELNISLDTGTIKFTKRFNLIFLYEHFLERKSKILCEKFGPGADQMTISFREHLQLFALKTVFRDNDLWELNIDVKSDKYYENIYELQVLQQEGIIFIEDGRVQNKRINFVHRTFAEYWAARWLSEQFNSECVEIKRTARKLIMSRFDYLASKFVFRMFDCILAINCPLHMLIINNQVDEAKKMIRANPDVLDVTDEGGRTVLHLTAMYGWNEDGDKLKDYTCMDEHIASVIRVIPNHKITNLKDKILGWSALDYALTNKAYCVANKMFEKKEDLIIGIHLDSYNVLQESLYPYCGIYKSLLKKLIPYCICLHILTSKIPTVINQNIISFVDKGIMRFYNFGFSELKAKTTRSEYLEAINIKSTPEPDYYNDLRFTVAFGTEDNVRHILSSSGTVEKINEVDCYKNTLLHYAVLKERHEMVKILLDHGASVNQPDYFGDTPIHLAAKTNSKLMIMNLLLSKQPEINKLNNNSQAPLHMAVLCNNLEYVKLLVERAANVNQPDSFGDTPIHLAANPNSEPMIMNLLLSKQPEINKLNNKSQSPLHLAVLNDKSECIELLLERAANISRGERKVLDPPPTT